MDELIAELAEAMRDMNRLYGDSTSPSRELGRKLTSLAERARAMTQPADANTLGVPPISPTRSQADIDALVGVAPKLKLVE